MKAAQRLSESDLAAILKSEGFNWADEVEEEETLDAGRPAAASSSDLLSPPTHVSTPEVTGPVEADQVPGSEAAILLREATQIPSTAPPVQKTAPVATQPLVATPVPQSTLDELDARVNALVEELAATSELRRKAKRRAILNLPGLSASLPATRN